MLSNFAMNKRWGALVVATELILLMDMLMFARPLRYHSVSWFWQLFRRVGGALLLL